jgi:hypothetical protein
VPYSFKYMGHRYFVYILEVDIWASTLPMKAFCVRDRSAIFLFKHHANPHMFGSFWHEFTHLVTGDMSHDENGNNATLINSFTIDFANALGWTRLINYLTRMDYILLCKTVKK